MLKQIEEGNSHAKETRRTSAELKSGLVWANINDFLSYHKVLGLPALFKLDPVSSRAAWGTGFNKVTPLFPPPS